MADNVDITPGSGATIGGDNISGIIYQRVKLIQGADGINEGDISSSAPLNVQLPTSQISTLTPLPDGHNVAAIITKNATRVQGKVDNADTTTAREVLAAVASNYVYITSFIISVAIAGNYWLEDGDAAQITPKFYLAANGGVSWTAVGDTPYKTTTVNKAINVKGSIAGAVGVMLTGYTATS